MTPFPAVMLEVCPKGFNACFTSTSQHCYHNLLSKLLLFGFESIRLGLGLFCKKTTVQALLS